MFDSVRKLTAAGLVLAGTAMVYGASAAYAAPHDITSRDDCRLHVRQMANEAAYAITDGHPNVDRLLDEAQVRCQAGALEAAANQLAVIEIELSQPQKRGD